MSLQIRKLDSHARACYYLDRVSFTIGSIPIGVVYVVQRCRVFPAKIMWQRMATNDVARRLPAFSSTRPPRLISPLFFELEVHISWKGSMQFEAEC